MGASQPQKYPRRREWQARAGNGAISVFGGASVLASRRRRGEAETARQ